MEGERLAETQLPAAAPNHSAALRHPRAAECAVTLELPESLIMHPFRETMQQKNNNKTTDKESQAGLSIPRNTLQDFV